MTADKQIQYLPLDGLREDPRNPKRHQEGLIGESVTRFGMIESVVLDNRTGYLISGHGRTKALRALKERGSDAPDGVRVGPGGEWLVPVLTGWASKDDAEARAALIALNRTLEAGGWEDETLLGLLDELSVVDGGFDGVGFGEEDLDDLRAMLADVEEDVDVLDEEDWNGGPIDKPPVKLIKLLDPAIQELWTGWREQFDNDDAALAAKLRTPEDLGL